ncbi:hypothetical protein CYMTET_27198, partial [Cymbomonas tetramitiformis]
MGAPQVAMQRIANVMSVIGGRGVPLPRAVPVMGVPGMGVPGMGRMAPSFDLANQMAQSQHMIRELARNQQLAQQQQQKMQMAQAQLARNQQQQQAQATWQHVETLPRVVIEAGAELRLKEALQVAEADFQGDPPPAGKEAPETGKSHGGEGGRRAPAGVPPADLARDTKLSTQRAQLPVHAHRDEILRAFAACSVVIVAGETGSGKTTQVPQYILEHAAVSRRPCSILCTQPRRISAIGVAERVAEEKGQACGAAVGYTVRNESRQSGAGTHLLFCTTGVLLRRLLEDPELGGVTHVFVDEVHERTIESDFLLMALRELLRRRRLQGRGVEARLSLCLMSATVNTTPFEAYFVEEGAVPVISIPGRLFPVTALFLEDALALTNHRIDRGAPWARRGGDTRDRPKVRRRPSGNGDALLTPSDHSHRLSQELTNLSVQSLLLPQFSSGAAAQASSSRSSRLGPL